MTDYILHEIMVKAGADIKIPEGAVNIRILADYSYGGPPYLVYQTPRPDPVVVEVVRYGMFTFQRWGQINAEFYSEGWPPE